MAPEDDTNGNFGKFFLEASSVLQCFEEKSAKIFLRTREPDAVLKKKSLIWLERFPTVALGTFGKQRTL